ncbi:MAG: ribosomal protein L7Ae/L30e/S12e/Gadd45 [Bacillales bacterium]|jgi:large subunit ribosomal protein L7A|nr:ribosomal protein L7Ae/L30e/S12e/Gadd45 [Bacillales bacterium]
MSYEKVANATDRVIGIKQTLRAVQHNTVKIVVIANDARHDLIGEIKSTAEKNGIPIIEVDSMKKLGLNCGISVGAASVGIIN